MTTDENTFPTGHFVHANGIDTYFEEVGSGPPLILVHGGLGNHSMMSPVLPALAKHFRVITPDSRGHGRTKNSTGEMSYRLLADDTAAFIQRLGLEKSAVCGYSQGGQVILELAMHHPEIACCFVAGGAIHRCTEASSAWNRDLGMVSPGVMKFELLEQKNPDTLTYVREQQDPFQGEGYWKQFMQQVSGMWMEDIRYSADDLSKIRAPLLIMTGDRDELAAPVELVVDMYRQIATAELAIVPGGDHGFPLAKLDLFTKLIVDFVLQHCSPTPLT